MEINQVIQGDCLEVMKEIKSGSVDMILSDIPYGIGVADWDVLHDNTNTAYLGSSPAQEKSGGVFKKRGKPLNGWSDADRMICKQYQEWCATWTSEWLRVLKPCGSAIIFAGRRMAHRCMCAMEDEGFTFKDMLCWQKGKAVHRAQRISVIYDKRGDLGNSKKWDGWKVGNLRPSFEPILWFTKPYTIGGTIADNMLMYQLGAFNEKAYLKYVKSPDNIIAISANVKDSGLHPTQKPLKLMQALIELITTENQVVLDPFCGSGTTLLAAQMLDRQYIGIEKEPKYVEIARNRIQQFKNSQTNSLFNL